MKFTSLSKRFPDLSLREGGLSVHHKVFLSHTHSDKPMVEAVALKLRTIFGQDQIFYDSWSIRPGDGIIDRMDQGLESPDFVFFFVSKNSLASAMVKLEWQNALFAASRGKTRLVPIRIDGSDMPAVLTQTRYIDMHTIGLDAAIAQIVSVIQGNASFTPQHLGFSNLSYTVMKEGAGTTAIVVKASHLMEPNIIFAAIVDNDRDHFKSITMADGLVMHSYVRDAVTYSDGSTSHGLRLTPMGGSLTPAHPLRFQVEMYGGFELKLRGLAHQKSEDEWAQVPLARQ